MVTEAISTPKKHKSYNGTFVIAMLCWVYDCLQMLNVQLYKKKTYLKFPREVTFYLRRRHVPHNSNFAKSSSLKAGLYVHSSPISTLSSPLSWRPKWAEYLLIHSCILTFILVRIRKVAKLILLSYLRPKGRMQFGFQKVCVLSSPLHICKTLMPNC
jgi:hypothetical protein